MKAYTNLEQSKKLAEILPIESADMYYQYVLPKSDRVKHNPEIGNPISALEWYNKGYTMSGKEPITMDEYCVHCWSLAALLEALPKIYKLKPILDLEENSILYSGTNLDVRADNIIDACVDMIIKLKEKNLI